MIIDITVRPDGESFDAEERRRVIALLNSMGHSVDFIDVFSSNEQTYHAKLHAKGFGVSESYEKRVAREAKRTTERGF